MPTWVIFVVRITCKSGTQPKPNHLSVSYSCQTCEVRYKMWERIEVLGTGLGVRCGVWDYGRSGGVSSRVREYRISGLSILSCPDSLHQAETNPSELSYSRTPHHTPELLIIFTYSAPYSQFTCEMLNVRLMLLTVRHPFDSHRTLICCLELVDSPLDPNTQRIGIGKWLSHQHSV